MNDPNAILKQFAADMVGEFPELSGILDDAKAGDISESQALRELSEIVSGNPELGKRFQQKALKALAPLMVEPNQALDHGGLLFHKKRGLPQLNPLVEAALIERAQFDGDIPELRTGGLPAGVAPAMPVETTARNPVALGQMLARASQKVAQKVAATEPRRQELVTDTALLDLVAGAGDALAVREQRDLILSGQSGVLDVPEYRRGQLPVPLRVTEPSGSALMALTPEERKKSAWQFLSTTQGRRSAEKGMSQLIQVKLLSEGFSNVTVRPFNATSAGMVLAAHQWEVRIDGPGSTQPAFSLIDTAAIVIAKRLAAEAGPREDEVFLEVMSVNTVDIRSVGWAGRLVSEKAALPA